MPYSYPCRSNIAIIIDGSRGLSSTDFNQEINLIALSLVTSDWTNFERIAVAEYGNAVEFTAFDYGMIGNLENFQNTVENIGYMGDALPNITRLLPALFIHLKF